MNEIRSGKITIELNYSVIETSGKARKVIFSHEDLEGVLEMTASSDNLATIQMNSLNANKEELMDPIQLLMTNVSKLVEGGTQLKEMIANRKR